MGPFEDASASDHVDLILSHVEDLPTLSPVAVRVLQVSSSPEADIADITRLIESDPALTSRLLRLCRRADKVTASEITTVQRAIVLLGLDAVRSTMLSVEIYGILCGGIGSAGTARLDERIGGADARVFDGQGFWRHSLGVACAAEILAERARGAVHVPPDEAFLCGLLHDLGKLALDRVLPRAFARCVQLSEDRLEDLAAIERRVIGLDHHTAGKRLAEHWGLPHAVQDVIWLHDHPAVSLPEVPHRALVSIVTIARAVTRSLHVGWSGSGDTPPDPAELCASHGLDPATCRDVESELFERFAQRSAHLGLEEAGDGDLLLESIVRANHRLGRLNARLGERARERDDLRRVVEAVAAFHDPHARPTSLASAMRSVARGAIELTGARHALLLWRPRLGADWQLHEFSPEGLPIESRSMGRPPAALDETAGSAGAAMSLLRWVGAHLGPQVDLDALHVIGLLRGPGPAAMLLHDGGPAIADGAGVEALVGVWGGALAAGAQHDGARRLGEQLADSRRRLAAAQTALVERESMARLGELAAGAAHEMNNPLTVISGKAQMLAAQLGPTAEGESAEVIAKAADRLSDLITSLHLFADPPEPRRSPVDVPTMLKAAARVARERFAAARGGDVSPGPGITVRCEDCPPAWIDDGQVGQALAELLLNALEAEPANIVELRAFVEPGDGRLMLSVRDDGNGMSERAVRHACDPFFSEKPAGRQVGLGLSRARRLVDLHGGELRIDSAIDVGTTVTIALPEWRRPAAEVPRAA